MTTPQRQDVTEPSQARPLCGEAEFAELVESLVADDAPHLFAVVQELGERVDGWIAAWDIAFDDHVEVIGVDGGVRLSVGTTDRAAFAFGRRPDITARVVWVNPDARTPVDPVAS